MRYIILFLALTITSTLNANPFKGSQIEYLGTELANQSGVLESEYRNTYQTSTKRINARINYNWFHVGLSNERVNVVNTAPDSIKTRLNHDRNFVGIGVHTNKTYLTYSQDTDSDLWEVELKTSTPLRWNLELIGGIRHRDVMGGSLRKSGGKRQTSLMTGLQYGITENIDIKAILEVGNNSAAYIDDRFLIGVSYTY